jgi:hypothetical protein
LYKIRLGDFRCWLAAKSTKKCIQNEWVTVLLLEIQPWPRLLVDLTTYDSYISAIRRIAYDLTETLCVVDMVFAASRILA